MSRRLRIFVLRPRRRSCRLASASAVNGGSSPSPRSSSTVTSPDVKTSTRGIIRVGRLLSHTQTSSIFTLEERIRRLRHVLQVELVAEVRGVLRQDAVAEERVDRAVLLLQPKLELGLELVEFVEVTHRADCSPRNKSATVPRPGTTSVGRELGERLEHEQPLGRCGCGTVEARLVDRLGAVHAAGRGRSRAAPSASRRASRPELALDLEQQRRAARAAPARSRARRRRSGTAAGLPTPQGSVSRIVERRRAPISSAASRIARLAVAEVRAEPDVGDASPPPLGRDRRELDVDPRRPHLRLAHAHLHAARARSARRARRRRPRPAPRAGRRGSAPPRAPPPRPGCSRRRSRSGRPRRARRPRARRRRRTCCPCSRSSSWTPW